MIILKSYKELEKFKKIIPADKNDGHYDIVLYEITENGKPADVVFDFAFNFSYMIYHNENLLEDDIDNNNVEGKLIAKDITFNYFVDIDFIEAENINIKKECKVKYIKVKNEISGFKVVAQDIMAKVISCKYVYATWLYCKDLECELLGLSDKEFKNIKAENIQSCGAFKENDLPF